MEKKELSSNQQLKVLKIIWISMLITTVFYLMVGFMQIHTVQIPERSPIANLVWGFAVVFAGMGFVLPNMLFKRDDGTGTGPGPDQIMQQHIVRYAMFESVAVVALANFLSQGVSFTELVVGVLIAFTLLIVHPPKLKQNF